MRYPFTLIKTNWHAWGYSSLEALNEYEYNCHYVYQYMPTDSLSRITCTQPQAYHLVADSSPITKHEHMISNCKSQVAILPNR